MPTEICPTRNMPRKKYVRQKSNDMSTDVSKNGLKREKLLNHLKNLYKMSIKKFMSISLLVRTLRPMLQSIWNAEIPISVETCIYKISKFFKSLIVETVQVTHYRA